MTPTSPTPSCCGRAESRSSSPSTSGSSSERTVLVRRKARGRHPELAAGEHRVFVRRFEPFAPASRAAAGAAKRRERLLGGDECVAVTSLVEVRLRLEVEARERAAGLFARLLGRGEEDPLACAGDGDVEEAALLFECAPRAFGLVMRPAREVVTVEERVLGAGERGEASLDEVADDDRVPLDALRLVDGEERDRVGGKWSRGQPVLRVELARAERVREGSGIAV